MPNAAIDPMTEPATTPGCCAGLPSLAAALETAVADLVCVALEESIVEDSRSEEFDEADGVEVLVEHVVVIVRVLKTVDVPVVVATGVLPMLIQLACVTPMKADTVRLMESCGVPDKSLGLVDLEPSVFVLVIAAAEYNVFVIVIVGEPFAP